MSRSIVTAPSRPVVRGALSELVQVSPPQGGVPAQQQETPDRYRDKLFKYIPAEAVTLYLGLSTVVAATQNAPHFLYWVIFAAGLIGTPVYLRFAQNVTKRVQLIVSTLSFAVWVFALGGPFADIDGYKPVYGAVLLPIFTFFVACISPGSAIPSGQQAPSNGRT
jgi:hypothetical protein